MRSNDNLMKINEKLIIQISPHTKMNVKPQGKSERIGPKKEEKEEKKEEKKEEEKKQEKKEEKKDEKK